MALAPDVMSLLVLLVLLQVKHFICDGPLQTKAMVDAKRHYGALLGLAHASIHGLGTLVVLASTLRSPALVVGLAALDAVIHYHVDFTKENVVRIMGWTPAQGPFWWAMTFDQMLHQWTYLALVAIVFSQS